MNNSQSLKEKILKLLFGSKFTTSKEKEATLSKTEPLHLCEVRFIGTRVIDVLEITSRDPKILIDFQKWFEDESSSELYTINITRRDSDATMTFRKSDISTVLLVLYKINGKSIL